MRDPGGKLGSPFATSSSYATRLPGERCCNPVRSGLTQTEAEATGVATTGVACLAGVALEPRACADTSAPRADPMTVRRVGVSASDRNQDSKRSASTNILPNQCGAPLVAPLPLLLRRWQRVVVGAVLDELAVQFKDGRPPYFEPLSAASVRRGIDVLMNRPTVTFMH